MSSCLCVSSHVCVCVFVCVFACGSACVCVCVCSGELAEVQALYRQSTEHAAQQGHLIRQLEGLNLDTQRVLRNQEEAHSVDATSYQRVSVDLRPPAREALAWNEPVVPRTTTVGGLR